MLVEFLIWVFLVPFVKMRLLCRTTVTCQSSSGHCRHWKQHSSSPCLFSC